MRSCLECRFFHFDEGSPAYSEFTGGTDPSMSCDATPSHWDLQFLTSTTEREVRVALLTADTCKDFSQVKVQT